MSWENGHNFELALGGLVKKPMFFDFQIQLEIYFQFLWEIRFLFDGKFVIWQKKCFR